MSNGLLDLKRDIDLLSDEVEGLNRKIDAICEHLDIELELQLESYKVLGEKEEDEEEAVEEYVE
jgi:hypothetical protein